MSDNVQLPALGESVTEGTVTRWLKNVGDRVEVDEPLLEISTDKVDTEVPSPFAGVLEQILVAEDETAEVGAVLAVIGDGSGAGGDAAPAESAPAQEEAPAQQTGATTQGEGYGDPAPEVESASPATEQPAPAPAAEAQGSGDGQQVTLPALGESVTEGTVTRWLKQVGDAVEVDEPLLEISTDKVDTEVPSPFAGTLQQILVGEDETAEVGAPLAVIGSGSAPAASGQSQDGAAQAAAPAGVHAAQAEWDHFKARFLSREGRVIDNMNGNVSHSEGQGFAMLLAVRFDDQETFRRLLDWTRGNLSRPTDSLYAWCFRPGEPGGRPGDRNNATDGDLMIAWALAEASDAWGQPGLRTLAIATARDILARMTVQVGERTYLLPGCQGFLDHTTMTTNPSYYIYPAFQALRAVAPSPLWAQLEATGLRLARTARFGRYGLVADWVAVGRNGAGMPGIAPNQPARFSYDACRVPLYMVWGGFGAEPMVEAAAKFWHDPSFRQMPAWTDLRTGVTSGYAADPGIAAIARLAADSSNGQRRPSRAVDAAVRPDAYYASVLRLLVRLAVADTQGGMVVASR
ncbi:MAG: glycosyl hydrolase family 8 [Cellulomonas sp.]